MKPKPPATRGCPRWCDYLDARNHPENHITHIGDVVPVTGSQSAVLAVTVESNGNSASRAPMLGTLNDGAVCATLLTWSEAEHLARLLLDANCRFS